MKRVLLIGLISLLTSELKGNSSNSLIEIEIKSRDFVIDQELKDILWINYLKSPERSWLKISPITSDSAFTSSESFYLKRDFSKSICAFLNQEGLSGKHIKIEYSNSPHVILYKPKGKMIYANYVKDNPKNKQVFLIDNNQGSICETQRGNRINFPPRAFKTNGGSQIQVEVYEYQSINDFVMSGYTSTANDQLISSSGMYNINASCNGTKASLKPNSGTNIQIAPKNFTDTNSIQDFQTFYGSNSDEAINWKPTYENLTDRRKSNTNKKRKKIKRIKIVTERHFASIGYNLPILEPKYNNLNKTTAEEDLLALAEGKNINKLRTYNQADYNYIISKYKLQKRTGKMDTEPIRSYKEFSKLMKTKRKDVFLELTTEQNQELVAAKKGYKKDRKKKMEQLKELANNEDAVKEAYKKAELKKFPIEMKIDQLGKINCDRFMEFEEKTNIIVKLNEFDFDEIRVYAIFNDIKSVIPAKYHAGSSNGFVQFSNLPVDKEVLYVAATFKGDEVKLAYLNKKIIKEDIIPLSLTTYSKNKYESIMNDLIPN